MVFLKEKTRVKHLFGILIASFLSLIAFSLYSCEKAQSKQRVYHVDPAGIYEGYNELYFMNSLPKDVLVTLSDIPSDSNEKVFGETLHIGRHQYAMLISPKYNDTLEEEEESVLHESCHIWVWEHHPDLDPKEAHGEIWQSCMLNLAEQGAFQDVW